MEAMILKKKKRSKSKKKNWGNFPSSFRKDLKKLDERQRLLVLIGVCRRIAWFKKMEELDMQFGVNGKKSGGKDNLVG